MADEYSTGLVVLTDDMVRRALYDRQLHDRIPVLQRFREALEASPSRRCTPCQKRRAGSTGTALSLDAVRVSLAHLNTSQQQCLKQFFGASKLAIDYKVPGTRRTHRVIY